MKLILKIKLFFVIFISFYTISISSPIYAESALDPPAPDSSSSFLNHKLCFKCHEMKPLWKSYYKGPHGKKDSEELTTCGSCHVRPGFEGILKDKAIKGSKEAYIHLKSMIKEMSTSVVIPQEKHNELSGHVRKFFVSTDSITCKECHRPDTMDFNSQNAFGRKKHALAIKTRRELIKKYISGVKDDRDKSGFELNSLNLLRLKYLNIIEDDPERADILIDELPKKITTRFIQGITASREDLLNLPENKKITCIDCHPYPGHKR